jgi:outer membrane protein TolC
MPTAWAEVAIVSSTFGRPKASVSSGNDGFLPNLDAAGSPSRRWGTLGGVFKGMSTTPTAGEVLKVAFDDWHRSSAMTAADFDVERMQRGARLLPAMLHFMKFILLGSALTKLG